MSVSGRPMLAVIATVCMSAALAGCGSKSDAPAASASSSSKTTTSTTTSSAQAAAPSAKLTPRNLQDAGTAANPTIADYIQQQHIGETAIHRGDPDAPQIDVPVPQGWQSAGDDTPDYAYGALVYPAAHDQGASYTPNIIALLSKLDGPVDADKLLSLAGGEMKNLPGFVPAGEESATVSGFPAYRIAGEYDLQGSKAASGQETVVISGQQGVYVLQLNATSDESQSGPLFDALKAIDDTIAITA